MSRLNTLKNIEMKKLLIVLFGLSMIVFTKAQNHVTVGDSMKIFSLKSTDGGIISLSDFHGKNVMIVFPRGKVGDHWCQICHYQYAELSDMQQKQDFEKKYNLKVLVILPYSEAEVKHWVEIFPSQLQIIDKWKNPEKLEGLTKGETDWMYFSRKLFPKKFNYPPTGYPMPFPVLIDIDHKFSSELGIFTNNWDGSTVDQNISSIYIVDKNGILKFKYNSQSTIDRPKPEYLFEVIERLVNN